MPNNRRFFSVLKWKDQLLRFLTFSFTCLCCLIFLALIGFVIYASIPGFKKYGFFNIFFSLKFNLSQNQASIWLPFCITILVLIMTIAIAWPFSIRIAIFLKFRIGNEKIKRISRLLIELLANIPSVIFGLFAISSLGKVMNFVFHNQVYSLITTSVMLAIMILPTVVSLTLNALDATDEDLIFSAIVLGVCKTKAIYKIFKKHARPGIIIAIVMGITRTIGETTAVNMVLQAQNYNAAFNEGFLTIWNSYLKTLGGFIATNMFAEQGGPELKSLLFGFGLFLFVVILFLNTFVILLTKDKKCRQHLPLQRFKESLYKIVDFIPHHISLWIAKITHAPVIDETNFHSYLTKNSNSSAKWQKIYTTHKLFWEWFCFIIVQTITVWIILDIIVKGINGCLAVESSIFSLKKDTTGQAFLNTLIIILLSIACAFPFGLMVAIYINEFLKKDRFKKMILFFVDSLGATPSILFGMFGMIFFIQTCGWTTNGSSGKSLLVGILTMIIVILPSLIRTIYQALLIVPSQMRLSAHALGISQSVVIFKIIIPACFNQLITCIMLAIGRILAETAPLYLTAGLTGSSTINFLNPGQTLTTRIYAQIFSNDFISAQHIMYECALITFIFVMVIIILVNFVIPSFSQKKRKKYTKN